MARKGQNACRDKAPSPCCEWKKKNTAVARSSLFGESFLNAVSVRNPGADDHAAAQEISRALNVAQRADDKENAGGKLYEYQPRQSGTFLDCSRQLQPRLQFPQRTDRLTSRLPQIRSKPMPLVDPWQRVGGKRHPSVNGRSPFSSPPSCRLMIRPGPIPLISSQPPQRHRQHLPEHKAAN